MSAPATTATLPTSFRWSGMVSYNGAKRYGLAVIKVLGTWSLAEMLQFAINAAA